MNIRTLTKKINKVSDKYAKSFGINRDADWYMFKLQEELGELTQAYLMYSNRARKKGKTDLEIKNNFQDELADCFCHILLLASFNKVDIDKAVFNKWLYRLDSKE